MKPIGELLDVPKREPTLQELVDRILAITSASPTGEISAEQDQELQALSLSLERKVQAYYATAQQLSAEAQAFDELAGVYRARCEARKASADALKARLKSEMERAGQKRIKTLTCTASIEKSPPKVVFRDGAQIPPRFCITISRPDKKAILEALERGDRAAAECATVVRDDHLRFRI